MLARALLTPDVRFEGWTHEDWIRFLGLWRDPRAATPGREPTRPRGGVVVVHESGCVLKLLHTNKGRIDPPVQLPALGALAQEHGASWALSLTMGALDEAMERFGARARRGDDYTTQSLALVGVVRELIVEGAIASWPQRLGGIPAPTPQVVRRTLDVLCPDGRAIALGLFDRDQLWTAFVARRRGAAFDAIVGPDALRAELGLLSGDWRRDYRHLARAVEDLYAPIGVGCFADRATLRALLLRSDATPGAWSRAVALRDVVVSPMPAAVGVALGFDAARFAVRGLRAVTGRVGKDVSAFVGFDPIAALRVLLRR